MAFIAFTEQEKNSANEADIVSYLKAQGESVVREGNEYAWQAPSGKVSIRGNQWYSQYEQQGGATVSFVRKYFGLSFPDAIKSILGNTAGQVAPSRHVDKSIVEKKEFELPEKHPDMRRVFAYLVKERLINREIVHNFASRGLIFEDNMHNVVFVGCDENGVARHAQKRSTNPVSSFKQNVAGSAAEYSFHHVGTSDRLYVFEAPIDMLAYITMNQNHWSDHSYVALASTADRAAIQMLRSYSHLKTVYLCLDHDAAGIEGAYRVADSIHELGDWSIWRLFPKNKDWDEDLKERKGLAAIPSSNHPKMQYVSERCKELSVVIPEKDYIYAILSKAKGYLSEDAFDKLKLLVEKLNSVETPKQKQQQLMHMAKVACAYAVLRSKQTGGDLTWKKAIETMQNLYRPHRDTACSHIQIQSLKNGLETLEQAIKTSKSSTQKEIQSQCEATLHFALCCIGASGAIQIELNKEQEHNLEMQ